jgi:signal recognition particle subunit SEC65
VSKAIDLSKSVSEICKEYPEVVDIMRDLGFENITNPAMMKTAGRFMTIPKGAAMKNIPMEKIKEAFAAKGYEFKE